MKYIQIENKKLSEIVSCELTSQHLKTLRGRIRLWLKAGMSIHDFLIRKAPCQDVYEYLKSYTFGESIGQCDLCQTPMKRKYINYLDDDYGVCLVAACNNCIK